MTKPDYYEVLGVSRDADEEEVKGAFRREALRWHPDRKPGDPDAEGRFKNAAEAYEVLGDPGRRAIYDSMLDRGTGRSAFADFVPGRKRGRGCGGGRGRGCARRSRGNPFRDAAPRPPSRHVMRLTIGPVEAVVGCRRKLTLDTARGRTVLSIELPRGLEEGDVVRLEGIPDPGSPETTTNIYLRIHISD